MGVSAPDHLLSLFGNWSGPSSESKKHKEAIIILPVKWLFVIDFFVAIFK
jgi:hypothetical protein